MCGWDKTEACTTRITAKHGSHVVYTPFDNHDGWQQKLVKELRAAGYTVDANALIN